MSRFVAPSGTKFVSLLLKDAPSFSVTDRDRDEVVEVGEIAEVHPVLSLRDTYIMFDRNKSGKDHGSVYEVV